MQCRNLVIVADTHCGCQTGLVPHGVRRIPLDEGGFYTPSPMQRKISQYWHEFWTEFVPSVCQGEPFALCVNGDALDGVHHGSVTQISHNLVDQANIARACFEPIIAQADALYWIRGTEAHVGASGQAEEALAKSLGAEPNEIGQSARYDLWISVGGRVLTHIMHHIGTTGSQAYEATAVHKELVEEYAEAGRWGQRAPQMIVRAHRHRMIATTIPTQHGLAHAIVTPGWQGKTPFTWKIPGARLATPQFGGVVVRAGDEVGYYREKHWTIERSRTE